MKSGKKMTNKGTFCGDADHYEDIQNFNFITKFLHRTRFRNLEILIIKASKEKKEKLKIVDIGCGDSSAYAVIKALDINFDYIGIELRKDFCDIANKKYNQYQNFKIIQGSVENHFEIFSDADVIIGLESFEHIPSWLVVRTIEAISKSSFMYLYLTVPNEVGPAILVKNVGSAIIGFDWRWLAQTLRLHSTIVKKTSSPANFIPKFISPSIGFICVKCDNNLN